jgi:hypothetical protein
MARQNLITPAWRPPHEPGDPLTAGPSAPCAFATGEPDQQVTGNARHAAAVITAEDADVDAVRAAYAAFARGDIDAAVADLAVDVEWIEPEEFPDDGRHVGREAVRGYLQGSRAVWSETRSTATVFRRGERVIAHHQVAETLHARCER